MTSCHPSPTEKIFKCTVYSYENNIEKQTFREIISIIF